MTDVIQIGTKEEVKALGSAITIIGLTLETIDDFCDWIEEYTSFKNRRAYVIKGSLMNEFVSNTDYFDDNLNIVSVDLNDLEGFEKLVFARFSVGAKWLDDIIDNL